MMNDDREIAMHVSLLKDLHGDGELRCTVLGNGEKFAADRDGWYCVKRVRDNAISMVEDWSKQIMMCSWMVK